MPTSAVKPRRKRRGFPYDKISQMINRAAKNIVLILVALFSGLTFIVIASGVTSPQNEFAPFDNAVERTVVPLRNPLMTNLMIAVTDAGSPVSLSILGFFLAIFLFWHRDLYDTLLYVFGLAIAVISFVVLKNAFGIPRPTNGLIAEISGWSFPSGHATVSTAFFFITGYSFWGTLKNMGARVTLATVCIASSAIISFSRVYLGVHFAIDVLAGTALGLLAVSGTILVFNLFLSEREWWRRRVRNF